jgi:hypothetical protein
MHDEEKQKNYAIAEKLIAEQNFAAALVAGAIATLFAAVAYGIVVATWGFSYGFMAAGIGVVVGLSMGLPGRGITRKFSVVAAAYTLIGCVLGNLVLRIVNMSEASATSPLDVIQGSSLSALAQWSVAGLTLIHLVFWFVAVAAAVFLAKRPLSRSQRLAIAVLESRA